MIRPGKLLIKGIKDSSTRKLVRECTLFFINETFTRQILPYIRITVHVTDKFDISNDGECVVNDVNVRKPRKFLIKCRCNPESDFENLLKTIAHEIVHCKQFAKKELSNDLTYWQGKEIPSEVDYWEKPWEVEAYKVQDELYEKLESMSRLEKGLRSANTKT